MLSHKSEGHLPDTSVPVPGSMGLDFTLVAIVQMVRLMPTDSIHFHHKSMLSAWLRRAGKPLLRAVVHSGHSRESEGTHESQAPGVGLAGVPRSPGLQEVSTDAAWAES